MYELLKCPVLFCFEVLWVILHLLKLSKFSNVTTVYASPNHVWCKKLYITILYDKWINFCQTSYLPWWYFIFVFGYVEFCSNCSFALISGYCVLPLSLFATLWMYAVFDMWSLLFIVDHAACWPWYCLSSSNVFCNFECCASRAISSFRWH